MKRESLELAQQALDIYQHDYSPAYSMIREKLAGSLAVNGLLLDELQFQRDSVRPNQELVVSFVDTLPKPKLSYRRSGLEPSVGTFETRDLSLVRMLEGNVVWLPSQYWDGNHRRQTTWPYYIVGERQSDDENTTELLVVPPKSLYEKADSIYIHRDYANEYTTPGVATVKTDEKEVFEAVLAKRMGLPFTTAEIMQMDTGNNKLLEISTDLAVGFGLGEIVRPRFRVDSKLPELVAKSRGIGVEGPLRLKGDFNDHVMARYDVFNRLNRLALAFNKVDILRELIEKQKETAPRRTPLESYVEDKPSDNK